MQKNGKRRKVISSLPYWQLERSHSEFYHKIKSHNLLCLQLNISQFGRSWVRFPTASCLFRHENCIKIKYLCKWIFLPFLWQISTKIVDKKMCYVLINKKIIWVEQDSNPQPLPLCQIICLHPKFRFSAVDSACQLGGNPVKEL